MCQDISWTAWNKIVKTDAILDVTLRKNHKMLGFLFSFRVFQGLNNPDN